MARGLGECNASTVPSGNSSCVPARLTRSNLELSAPGPCESRGDCEKAGSHRGKGRLRRAWLPSPGGQRALHASTSTSSRKNPSSTPKSIWTACGRRWPAARPTRRPAPSRTCRPAFITCNSNAPDCPTWMPVRSTSPRRARSWNVGTPGPRLPKDESGRIRPVS